MLGDFRGYFGGHSLLSRVDGADGFVEFLSQKALQEIAASAGLDGPLDLDIADVGCEDDDAGTGGLPTDGVGGLNAVHFGHLQIHEGNIRTILTKKLDGFQAVARLSDQFHVGLFSYQGGDAFTENRVVIHAENSNHRVSSYLRDRRKKARRLGVV